MDLWEIVHGSEDAPPSDGDPKIIKEYQRRVKKAMSIIGINLVDSQLHPIKRCKGPAEAWRTLCNIHETRSLGEWRNRAQVLPNSKYGGGCVDKSIGKGATSKPYKKHGIRSLRLLAKWEC
jgi:hypothetical protein